MRRSKAVEEIRKILAMNGKDNGEGELEEAILHHLESLCMLPPPTKTDVVTDYLVYCYYPKVSGDDTDQIDVVNSQLWEPEDEEK